MAKFWLELPSGRRDIRTPLDLQRALWECPELAGEGALAYALRWDSPEGFELAGKAVLACLRECGRRASGASAQALGALTVGQVLNTGQNVQALTMTQTFGPTASADGVDTPPAGAGSSVAPAAAQPPTATSPYAPPGVNQPPAIPGLFVAQALAGCGSCVFFGFGVAGFVLNIMVCRALYGTAREAERIALPPPQTLQPPSTRSC